MARNSANMIIRDAVETDLPELFDIQKAAFMRYTDRFLPDQIPPLNETLDEVRSDFYNKQILVAEIEDRLAGSVRYSIKAGVCIFEKYLLFQNFRAMVLVLHL